MFRRILVPLDGSPLAEFALPFAMSIARHCGAAIEIAVVHVPGTYYDEYTSEDLDAAGKIQGQQYLETLARNLAPVFPGPLRVQLLEGLVPETLTQEVAERGADLVVMNANGWGYLSRALIGSVSDYLMRHLNVPLLLLHGDRPPSDLTTEVACQRGLVCLDGSELSEAILPGALAIGRLWKSQFRLLRIVAPANGWVQSQMAPADDQRVDQATTAASTYLDVVAQPIRAASLRVETRVLTGRNIAADILHDADANHCDWIAISTHGRGGLSRLLLGSVADKVVRGAHTPVLVYHPAA